MKSVAAEHRIKTYCKGNVRALDDLSLDVMKHPEKVREIIGLSGQYAVVDETLIRWDNFGGFLSAVDSLKIFLALLFSLLLDIHSHGLVSILVSPPRNRVSCRT